MKRYSYDDLKKMEIISVAGLKSVSINEITLFEIDQIHLHEFDHEYIVGRILKSDNGIEKEIGNFIITQNQGLSMDDKIGKLIIETYF